MPELSVENKLSIDLQDLETIPRLRDQSLQHGLDIGATGHAIVRGKVQHGRLPRLESSQPGNALLTRVTLPPPYDREMSVSRHKVSRNSDQNQYRRVQNPLGHLPSPLRCPQSAIR